MRYRLLLTSVVGLCTCAVGSVAFSRTTVPAKRVYPVREIQPAGTFEVGAGPYSVQVADLNRDGVQDIVTANLNGESITLLIGESSGVPAKRVDLGVHGAAIASVVTDFDADGWSDVVVAVHQSRRLGRATPGRGHIAYVSAPRDGSGRAEMKYLNLGRQAKRPTHVDAGDLDGDGVPEVVVAIQEDVLIILGYDGRGELREKRRVPVAGCGERTGYGPDGVSIADIDRDGDLDLVVACYDTWSIRTLENDGTGRFGPARLAGAVPEDVVLHAMRTHLGDTTLSPVGGGLRKVVASDVSGSAKLDLLAMADYGLLLVIPGDSAIAPHTVWTGVDGTNTVVVGELGIEHRKDVLMLTGHDPYLGMRLPATRLSELRPVVERFGPLPMTPESIVVRDIDDDEINDLIIAGEHAGGVLVLRGDSLGGFSPFPRRDSSPRQNQPLVSSSGL